MAAYYNEHDAHAAQWLRNLIERNLIAPGEVDERSIEDVVPSDLRGFIQCHFFAGIGVWSYALRRAGWPDDRPVWTGSCPCQPFSAAGKRSGKSDERHLWPVWFELIKACRPPIVLGEQVASSDVIGRATRKADHLQGLRDREELRRVSNDWLAAEIPWDVQELSERAREIEEIEKSLSDSRAAEGVETQESRVGSGFLGACEGERERIAVRSGRDGNPETDRHRAVRTDGDLVRLGGRLEQPVARQNQSISRLRDGERQDSALGPQPHDEQVGARESPANSGRLEGETGEDRAVQLTFAGACGAAEGKDCGTWLDDVFADLGRAHYTVGACDSPAAGFGAPHIRQRLYWVGVADATWSARKRNARSLFGTQAPFDGERLAVDGPLPVGLEHGHASVVRMADAAKSRRNGTFARAEEKARDETRLRVSGEKFGLGGVAHPESLGLFGRSDNGDGGRRQCASGQGCEIGGMGYACGEGLQERIGDGRVQRETLGTPARQTPVGGSDVSERPGPTNGLWRDVDWLFCTDGKWRPVEPESFPLVDGSAFRVGSGSPSFAGKSRAKMLKGYGNAINAEQAAEFIKAAMDVLTGA